MTKRLLAVLIAAAFLWGCSKDDNGTNPPPTPEEDWTFPADSIAATGDLYIAVDTTAVGTTFDLKAVLYNVDSVWAATLEIGFSPVQLEVLDALAGPFIGPDADILVVRKVEADSARASFGITFRRGTHPAGVSGSGAVMKLKCRARAAGTGSFTLNTAKLQVLKPDGSQAVTTFRNATRVLVVQ
jgi:hypothetical protein